MRLSVVVRTTVRTKISIHAPTWGATHGDRARLGRSLDFNPRTHVGCDSHHDKNFLIFSISIHAPTWGATLQNMIIIHLGTFQSTHPRGVRRVGVVRHEPFDDISIHAPTWGATGGGHIHVKLLGISIHAPTWGATSKTYRQCRLLSISIHAPTWGATHRRMAQRHFRTDFNPRTHVGCDGLTTTPTLSTSDFNPRTHVGCDGSPPRSWRPSSRFQSTHPRGVRHLCVRNNLIF